MLLMFQSGGSLVIDACLKDDDVIPHFLLLEIA